MSFEVNLVTGVEEGRDRWPGVEVRVDLTLFVRGIIDCLFGDDVALCPLLASEALVGEKSVLETDLGIAEGFADWTSAGLDAETSSASDRRSRFAGLVFSRRSDMGAWIDLNGLADPVRPLMGGGMREGVPLPAVRGRSGSSKPALEPLLFSD